MDRNEIKEKSLNWTSFNNFKLKVFRASVLLNKASLTEKEIKEIQSLNFFYLLEKHRNYLTTEYKIKLIEEWWLYRKNHSYAIRMILANWKDILDEKPDFFNYLLLYSGNHYYRSQKVVTRHLSDYVYKYYFDLSNNRREYLIEMLVHSINKITQRSVLFLFHRRFFCMRHAFRNHLLTYLLDNEIIPPLYFKDFLLNKTDGISEKNIALIRKRLSS